MTTKELFEKRKVKQDSDGEYPYIMMYGEVDEIIKELEASIRKEVVEEIQKGVDIYKVPKELVRVNKLKADYIYVYDLNTFILNKLTN